MKVTKDTKTTYDLTGLTLEEVQAILVALTAIHNSRANYCESTVSNADCVHASLVNEVN